MNSFFATAEQQANPYLRGRPVGITKAVGRGCIIAASIEAKKYGIKTGSTVWEAKKLYPGIILVPSDMDKYFGLTHKMISIVRNYSPAVEVFSIDEIFADITQTQLSFAGGSLEMALEIKKRIREVLGEWMRCSVGVSFNKIAAKLASEMNKPDGLTFLTPENYVTLTNPIKVAEVCGIGRAREKWFEVRGVRTLEEARSLKLPAELENLVWLRDEATLVTEENLEPAKSVSRTYTTYKELTQTGEIRRLVRNLVEETAEKLRNMNMTGRTMCLSLRSNGSGENFWARRTMKNGTNDGKIIFETLWRDYQNRPLPGVRFAGVGISNLVNSCQLSVITEMQKREELLRAVDGVNERFGGFTMYPAQLLGGELIRPEVTGFLGDKWYRFRTNPL